MRHIRQEVRLCLQRFLGFLILLFHLCFVRFHTGNQHQQRNHGKTIKKKINNINKRREKQINVLQLENSHQNQRHKREYKIFNKDFKVKYTGSGDKVIYMSPQANSFQSVDTTITLMLN